MSKLNISKLKFSEKGPKNPDPGVVDSVGYSSNVHPQPFSFEGISNFLMGFILDPGLEPNLSEPSLGVLFSLSLTGFVISFLSGDMRKSLLGPSRKDFLPLSIEGERDCPFSPPLCLIMSEELRVGREEAWPRRF